ncbi:SOS response-associated peptidase [Acidobacteria bacterium AB60]|nr:SOS response-associated peptidase [Acidobacteria bacterium AB60]
MCGRYGRRSDKQRITEWMQIHHADVFDDSYLNPDYNVAPQTIQPVVLLDRDTGRRRVAGMRWGLIPYWSRDTRAAFSNINARAETVATNSSFREAMKRRRCLVPADLFYEWQKTGAKTKQPFAVGMKDGSIFAFAGLWETWRDEKTGMLLETYTIITTDPNELIKPEAGPSLHDRMPVILDSRDYDRWLEPGDPDRLPVDLLRPYDAEKMRAWKVGARVGNVKNNDPDLCAEVNPENETLRLFPDM